MIQRFSPCRTAGRKYELLSVRCGNRANTFASTAINTSISIDYVLVIAGSDSIYRTFAFALSAVDAVVIDKISHFLLPPCNISGCTVSSL